MTDQTSLDSGTKNKLTSEQAALQLMYAENEAEVLEVLNNPFFSELQWHPLGGDANENNYPTVKNQASHPMAALTEIIVNAQDAILLRKFREQFEDDQDPPTFETAQKAAEAMVDSDDKIRLRADGDRPRHDEGDSLNLTVIDKGGGQQPGDFEDNFLGLFQPGRIKQEYPFLHGQYGMGSTAVLPFCGDRGFKLILSAGHEIPENWSWTLIRKNREEVSFQYLTVGGEIPTFEGEVEGQRFGSFVKMYDYDAEVKSNITVRLRRYLERFLLNTPIQVQLEETRYGNEVDSLSTKGLIPHIDGNDEIIEEQFTVLHDFDDEDGIIGEREIHVTVFESDDVLQEKDIDLRRKREFVSRKMHTRYYAAFYDVDGQTHAGDNRTFLTNRCNLKRVGKDTIIHVEFSDLGLADKTDLFQPSRDGTRDPLGPVLKEGMVEALTDEEGRLRELEQERRRQDTERERDETVTDALEDIIGQYPHLADYFNAGEHVDVPDDEGEEIRQNVEREVQYIPETFKIIEREKQNGELVFWEPEEGEDQFVKDVAIDGTGVVKFRLDAPNDYFDRDERPGDLEITPNEMVSSWSLANGILRVRLKPLPATIIGANVPVEIRVGRDGNSDLTQSLSVRCIPSREEEPGEGEDEDETTVESIGLPDPYRINEDEWDERNGEEGWDEHDIVEMFAYEDDMEIFINMDSAPLRQFLRTHQFHEAGRETVKDLYETAIVLFTVCEYVELTNETEEAGEEELDAEQLVEITMRGIAQTLLPQLISEDRLEELTV